MRNVDSLIRHEMTYSAPVLFAKRFDDRVVRLGVLWDPKILPAELLHELQRNADTKGLREVDKLFRQGGGCRHYGASPERAAFPRASIFFNASMIGVACARSRRSGSTTT